ncbi:GroES-like protein [Hyaloscypha variabilis F]|uniref:GroES-like protein n=1 Tax=Hyaloscypha variabilis (strain UAMH 11265 / GT02V1 / F) TaxID=1149755 RepID=A0A2J6R1P1_HYAVF|nr:GroES-like protein [Hyaloscypha variabilis F]
MATMRALRLTKDTPTSAPTLTLTTVPKPTLTPGHLLVKVHASAIHPSDLLNARGSFPYTIFPRVPGRDYAGTVVEGPPSLIGTDVYGTSGVTQAFTLDGAHAEFILVSEAAVAPKPKNLSFVQAATIPVPFTTASLVLRRAALKEGDVVLVLGANGAVGSAVVQLARSLGAKVLLGTRDEKGDVNTAADPELKKIDELTGGKGVDVVVDTVGQPALTRASVAKLGKSGRLAFIAAPRSGATELGIEMVDFYRKEKTLVGCNTLVYSVEEFAEELKVLGAKFESGSLTPAKEGEWNEAKLEDGVQAYEKSSQKGGGKFVIVG